MPDLITFAPFVTFAGLFATGFFLGMLLLSADKYLNKYIGTPEGIFHTFQTYVLISLLAVFVIMGTRSSIGRGLVIGMMLKSVQGFSDKKQRVWGLVILGVCILLLLVP